MLIRIKDLQECAIEATDGKIGHVTDVYFDNETWTVRYLVVDTGSWLLNRKVLIAPIEIEHSNWTDRIVSVGLTREQVKNSPDIDTDRPVSQQHEKEHQAYYGYQTYSGGALTMTGHSSVEPAPADGYEELDVFGDVEEIKNRDDDQHLRSGKVVNGYHIEAIDGDIGHVGDLLVDEETWAVRYFIINTSNWWLGHLVLIAPQSIKSVSWATGKVVVSINRQIIKNAPPYDATTRLDRAEELNIKKYYERPVS